MKTFDILIAGFGTAGAMAAIAAARRGASVLVLEKSTYPGGTHTGGFIPSFYRQKPVGLSAELDRRACEIARRENLSVIEAKKNLFEAEAVEAGAKVRYGALPVGVTVRDGVLVSVRWLEDGQLFDAACTVALDATGDAALCRLAGCELLKGRDSDGQFQPFTNTMCVGPGGGLYAANFDAGRIDQTSAAELSRGMLETMSVHLSNDFSSGTRLLAPADLPGIREGVHIVAEEQFTLPDFFAGKPEPETLGYMHSNLDTHATDMALESTLFQDWMVGSSMWGTELWFPVPRRALLPRGTKNLLAASRCWGVDHDLGHALRMNPGMGMLGEAAAEWAVLALPRHGDLAQVPYAELAARLPLPPSPLAENDRVLKLDDEAIRAGLAGNRPGFAQWAARDMDLGKLKKWFADAPDGDFKRHAAFALALRGDPAGLSLLRQMVLDRDPFTPETSRKYNRPRGVAALYFLGRLADAPSIDLIGKLLAEPPPEHAYEYRTHAIAALLRIGEAHRAARERAAVLLKAFAEDPAQTLVARLKGTVATMKRQDAAFRIVIAGRLDAWSIPHRIREALDAMPLDFHEERMAERVGRA